MSSDIVYENQDDAGAENQFYRAVKTYVLRKGRMTAAQERDYNELSPVWCIPFENKKIAGRNPDINYIGIEVHTPGVGRLLGEIRKRDLKNLFIIEHDALEVLECMIVDGSISGFHIFFPDPWQKKRHHKRRLVQRPHTDLIAKKLAPSGYLYFVTDWYEYAEFALSQLTDTPCLHNKYESFAESQSWRPETKFERRGLNEDRPITELYFLKDE